LLGRRHLRNSGQGRKRSMNERRRELRLDPDDRREAAASPRKATRPKPRAVKPRAVPSWRRRLGWAALRWSLVAAVWGVGLLRAVFINLRAGHVVQGGSTITQQLAKNLFLTPERTFGRKIQEMELSLWLEHKFTKDQLLEIYLNRVYLGAGTYGVDAAAHR